MQIASSRSNNPTHLVRYWRDTALEEQDYLNKGGLAG
jgi:hypothetical protein